jgi:hypothetical protein
VKQWLIFAGAALGIIIVAALLLGLAFAAPAEQRAIKVSALVAYAVQLFGFAVVLVVRGSNVFAAWELAMLLRFAALMVFAFFALKGMGLPPAPALISLVAFFFLTTLVEPVLLKR